MSRYSTLFILLLNFFVLFGQDDSIADSLLYRLESNDYHSDSEYFDILYNLSYYHSNPDSSILFANKLIDKSLIQQENLWLYRGFFQKGSAQRIKGDLDASIESYFESLEFAKHVNYTKGVGCVYTALGDVYSTSKQYKKSVEYYNKGIEIFTSIQDSLLLGSTLLNVGTTHSEHNQINDAIRELQRALEIFVQINYPIGIAYCKGNIGKIYVDNNNLNKAEEYILEALKILHEIGDDYSLSINKRYLSNIYLKKNQLNKALFFATESLEISISNAFKVQIRDASFTLSSIYSKLQDFKNAYHYQSQYIAYRDSINNEETIREMADLRTEYEVAQKQAEVEAAQTQLELETKRRQNQQIIGLALIVVLVLTGVLSYVLFRNAKRERYVNKLLREQKEEMRTQRDLLEDVNNTKDRFFSIISHDLRGPIGVLNGTTMLIREFLESKDYSQLDDLTSNMEYSVKKVQTLLDNLLEWAVSQRGQYNYMPERVELNQLMLETISIFSDIAQAKNIVLTYEQKYAEAYVTVDRNSLSTIMRNLISNGLKFTQKYGTVSIVVEKSDNDILILVKDTGVGIPQEKINTLFDIEAKKSTWGTDKEKGLGIGLNLVYEFVKINKGDIRVRSSEGIGTTFIITLPVEHQMAGTEKAQYI